MVFGQDQDDEPEFSELCEAHGRKPGGARRVAHQRRRDGGHDGLPEEERRNYREDRHRLVEEEPGVHEHPQ